MLLPTLAGFLALFCAVNANHRHGNPAVQGYDHPTHRSRHGHGNGEEMDPEILKAATNSVHAADTTLVALKHNIERILKALHNENFTKGRADFSTAKLDEFRNQLDVALSMSQVALDDLENRGPGTMQTAPKMIEWMPGMPGGSAQGSQDPAFAVFMAKQLASNGQSPPGMPIAPGYGPVHSIRSPYHLPAVEVFKRLIDLNADVQSLLKNINDGTRHNFVSLSQNMSPQFQVIYNKYTDRRNKELYTENDTEKVIKLIKDIQVLLMDRMREDFSDYARQLIDDERLKPLIQAQLSELDRLEGLLIVKVHELAQMREKQQYDPQSTSYHLRKKVDQAGAMALLFFDYVKVMNGKVQIDWKPIRYSFYGEELERLFNEGTGEPLDEAIRVAQKLIDQLNKTHGEAKTHVERQGDSNKNNAVKYHTLQFWQFQLTNRLTELEALKSGYHSHHMNHSSMFSPYSTGYGMPGMSHANYDHHNGHQHRSHHY